MVGLWPYKKENGNKIVQEYTVMLLWIMLSTVKGVCVCLGKVSHSELPVTFLESIREERSKVPVAYTHIHM